MDYIDEYGLVVVDPDTGDTEMRQVRRAATAQEQAEIDAMRATGPAHAANAALVAQIEALEAEITPRRLRESLVSGDMTFINGVEFQITQLRAQLIDL